MAARKRFAGGTGASGATVRRKCEKDWVGVRFWEDKFRVKKGHTSVGSSASKVKEI
jgi:hypothetical protein